MTFMLFRNRVSDFRRWKRVFDSHGGAHRGAGLRLNGLWRSTANPDEVFFMFEARNVRKARAFISAPGAADAPRRSGVVGGDHLLRDAGMGSYLRAK